MFCLVLPGGRPGPLFFSVVSILGGGGKLTVLLMLVKGLLTSDASDEVGGWTGGWIALDSAFLLGRPAK